MSLTRKPDWPTRLHGYIRAHAETPFRYGSFDCGLFAAGAIQAMTDVDVARYIRGGYRTQLGAARLLKCFAGEVSALAIGRYTAALFEIPEIDPKLAGRGDVVCVGAGREGSLGIVAMHGTDILGPGEHGLVRFPLLVENHPSATAAWRI